MHWVAFTKPKFSLVEGGWMPNMFRIIFAVVLIRVNGFMSIGKEECKGIKISLGFLKSYRGVPIASLSWNAFQNSNLFHSKSWINKCMGTHALNICWRHEFRAHFPFKYLDRVISHLWRIDISTVLLGTDCRVDKLLSNKIINSLKMSLSLLINFFYLG